MKIVIIGNGVAGTFTAQHIRAMDKEAEITLISKELYPYYSRIKLPELISEQLKVQDLIVFKEEWYNQKNITSLLNVNVKKINPKEKNLTIYEQDSLLSYDKLIIATGSTPNIPSIKNAKNLVGKGVFTLRNIDDALEIQKYVKDKAVNKAIIIGGGLLGLELAKQIKNCNLDTTVVEFFPRLLPRQLDVDCGGMLKGVIEDLGIKVELNAATEEIVGNGSVKKIKIKDGRELDADMVLIQAGITPTIDLAVDAKLATNRGIIVNHYLETNIEDIYAVGDCIEYKSQIWGIIPACMEQAKVLAASILNKKTEQYDGTVPKNTLKIMGIDLTSIGIFDPEDKDMVGAGWQILKSVDEKGNCYKKIILKDNKIKGAILFGDKKPVPYVSKNIESEINEKELRKAIELYEWICGNCGMIYDEAKMIKLFKTLPEDWKCKCGAGKDKFKIKEE